MKITRLVSILIVALLITIIAVGCSDKAADVPVQGSNETITENVVSYKDGTYEGEANGFTGALKVEVVVKDGKIADVIVTHHNETQDVGTKAIDQLPGEIVEIQSTDVDAVAGATASSEAIKEAVEIALGQAK